MDPDLMSTCFLENCLENWDKSICIPKFKTENMSKRNMQEYILDFTINLYCNLLIWSETTAICRTGWLNNKIGLCHKFNFTRGINKGIISMMI